MNGQVKDHGKSLGFLQPAQQLLLIGRDFDTDAAPDEQERLKIDFQGIRGWVSASDIDILEAETDGWFARKQGDLNAEPDPIDDVRPYDEVLREEYRLELATADASTVWDEDELRILLFVVRKIAQSVSSTIAEMGADIDAVTAFRLMFTPLTFIRSSKTSGFWGLNSADGHVIELRQNAFHGNDRDFTPADLIAHEIGHCYTQRYSNASGTSINSIYHNDMRDADFTMPDGRVIELRKERGHRFVGKADDSQYNDTKPEYLADALGNLWLDRLTDDDRGRARRLQYEELMRLSIMDRLWDIGLAANFETNSGRFFRNEARILANLPELDPVIESLRSQLGSP